MAITPLTFSVGITGNGKKFTSNANTAEKLQTAAAYARRVHITAHETNTDVVVVGNASIIAGAAGDVAKARIGVVILPGGTVTLSEVFLDSLYISSVTSGEGVSYTYET